MQLDRSTMNYSLLLLSLMLASVSSAPVQMHRIEKRRVKPRTDQPLTLEELERQCIHHGWSGCINAINKYKSDIDAGFRQCREEVVEQIHKNSVSTESIMTESWAPITQAVSKKENIAIDDLESVTRAPSMTASTYSKKEDIAIGTTKAPPTLVTPTPAQLCPDRTKFREAQTEYCNSFKQINETATSQLIFAKDYEHCVSYKPDESELTPTEILGMINHWLYNINKVRDSNAGCNCDWTATGMLDLSTQTRVPKSCGGNLGSVVWEYALRKIADTMKAAEQLESLGRRKKCLRGCVWKDEVICTTRGLL